LSAPCIARAASEVGAGRCFREDVRGNPSAPCPCRDELATFLRRRQARLPARVRRTVGLRREEGRVARRVASLGGMSSDYCNRLEQAGGPHPSTHLLVALARLLSCRKRLGRHTRLPYILATGTQLASTLRRNIS